VRQRKKDEVAERDRFVGGERLAWEVDAVLEIREDLLDLYFPIFLAGDINELDVRMPREYPDDLFTGITGRSDNAYFYLLHSEIFPNLLKIESLYYMNNRLFCL
jgi:hypothetical protein